MYRNYRLIIKGTWFKLVPHGELGKLARVRIDIPNSLDNEWKTTVDKSEAQIPNWLKLGYVFLISFMVALFVYSIFLMAFGYKKLWKYFFGNF